MATMLYSRARDLTATSVTPSSWSAGWTRTTGADTVFGFGLGFSQHSLTSDISTSVTTSASTGEYGAHHRWVVGPLAAQTISGTISAQQFPICGNAALDATMAMAAKVITSAGADRGILLAVTASTNLTYEIPTTQTNRSFRDSSDNTSVSLSSVDVTAGDYLVVEVGYYKNTATSTTVRYSAGSSTTVLPVDDSTTNGVPWIKFSQDIAFLGAYVVTKSVPLAHSTTFTNTADPTSIVPPEGINAGDLVVMIGQQRATGATLAVSNAGGQTWTTETAIGTTNQTARVFWCVYDGTWDANPSVNFSAAVCNSVVMHVFRAYGSGTTWAVNVSQTELDIAAAATQTITGQTTTGSDPTITLAGWFTADDNGWGSISGANWYNPYDYTDTSSGTFVGVLNTSGSDQSCTFAFQRRTTAGATGNVSMTQTSNGNDAATTFIITFSATAPVATTRIPPAYILNQAPMRASSW